MILVLLDLSAVLATIDHDHYFSYISGIVVTLCLIFLVCYVGCDMAQFWGQCNLFAFAFTWCNP